MAAQGHTTVNFGAWPGSAQAQITITGQTALLATSDAEAWVRCEASADHSAQEHGIEDFRCMAMSITPGSGFTIVLRPERGRCYGAYNVSWVWS